MSVKNEQDTAFLLHQRPYRETSVIADFLTPSYGYIRAVCKGVKGNGKSAKVQRSVLQPFAELSFCWAGKGELKSARGIELVTRPSVLEGRTLYAALYVNELLMRLSGHQAQSEVLYLAYKTVLHALSSIKNLGTDNQAQEPIRQITERGLREFEFCLLKAIGYEVDFEFECHSDQIIQGDAYYSYRVGYGFSPVDSHVQKKYSLHCIPGATIIDLRDGAYTSRETFILAKLLTRESLRVLLGDKPLKTRELFI